MEHRQTGAEGEAAPEAGRWVLLSTILASSMTFINGSALNVALPALQSSLQASGAQLLWVINGYLLMLAALILTGGSLGDHFGRKRVFMAGISVFILASLACGLAPTIEWLIAARFVQGIGGAFMIPGSLAILSAAFDPDRRGQAIGTWSAATTLAFVLGPVLGGLLAEIGWWRGVFLINLPLGILALLALYFKVPESQNEASSGPVDLPGAALVTLGLAGLTYGFIAAPDLGFGNPQVLGALVLGLLGLAGFTMVEARSRHPMMPLHLFNSRTFSGANLLTLFLYGGLSVATLFISLNLIQIQGYSESQAGLAILPFAVFLTLLSRWAGSFADRRGPRLPLILGPALTGLGFLLIGSAGLTRGPSDYWTAFFPGIALYGIGMGFTVAPLTTSVMSSVATQFAGTASGINNAISRTAGVLAIAIVGSGALLFFSRALAAQTAGLTLSDPARGALQAEAGKLGDASVPAEVSPENAAEVEEAIRLAYVNTFKMVMSLSAGLAWLSALMAAILIEALIEPETGKEIETAG